jgi:ubiquinone/menaquinone biosynthesis C-methylase UbiE
MKMQNHNLLTAKSAIRLVSGVNEKSVLVVGCNRGMDCSYFIDAGASVVVGLDVIDDIGTEFAHPQVHYHKASAEQMPFPSDMFDLVYCFATMEHVPRIDLAFSEMARVVKVGGCVYCLAAPLWNSSQGHHMSLFTEFPWIHLRKSKSEILEYCLKLNLKVPNGGDIQRYVDYMLDKENFNMTPAKQYLETCSNLQNMIVVQNLVRLDKASKLTESIMVEMNAKGLEPHELLARTHWYVAFKKSNFLLRDIFYLYMLRIRHFSSTLKRVLLRYI